MENNEIIKTNDNIDSKAEEFNELTSDVDKLGTHFIYELSMPVDYNGETIEKLSIDFDKLKGKDAKAIAIELRALGITVIAPTMSDDYLTRAVVKASDEKIGVDFFDLVSIYDYHKLIGRARAFFMR